MEQKTRLHHCALVYPDNTHADIFFTKILNLSKVKSFTLSKDLTIAIFGRAEQISITVYENEYCRFEVFFHPVKNTSLYEHVCIEVDDFTTFFDRCRQYGLEPFTVEKEGKKLVFVRDFSGYLFEIKEQKKERSDH